MPEKPSARPFATDGGRKWVTMWSLFAFGFFIAVCVFLKVLVPQLAELDIAALERILGLLAGIGATFIGVNGWVTVRSASSPETMPADQETVPAAPADDDV